MDHGIPSCHELWVLKIKKGIIYVLTTIYDNILIYNRIKKLYLIYPSCIETY